MGKIKAIVFELSGWALCLCAGVIVYTVFRVFFSGGLLGPDGSFVLARVSMTGVLATMSGILVAIGAQLLASSKHISDKEEQRSRYETDREEQLARYESDRNEQFLRYETEKREQRSRYYLDACVLAHEEAWKALQNGGTNKRTDWVQAATTLWNAGVLKKEITEESHLRVLEVHMLKYRYAFSGILEQHSISFYGVSPHVYEEIKHLEGKEMLDAAEKQMRKAKVRRKYEPRYDPGVHSIPEPALYMVWSAAQFPYEKLEDHPIYNLRFSRDEMTKMSILNEEVFDYLNHRYPRRKRNGDGEN